MVLVTVLTVPTVLTAQASEVILAAPASTLPRGLLDSLVPLFERQGAYKVRVIGVSSAEALEKGKRGEVDVVLIQARPEERALVDGGVFTSSVRMMANDYIIVGPPNDPIELRGSRSAVHAFKRMVEGYMPFVSCADRTSPVHRLELDLWKRADVMPPGRGSKYIEAKRDMIGTLQLATQQRAYALTDRATYNALKARLDLVPLVQGDSLFANEFHVLEVAGKNAQRVNAAGAHAFALFLVSPEAQSLIGSFNFEP